MCLSRKGRQGLCPLILMSRLAPKLQEIFSPSTKTSAVANTKLSFTTFDQEETSMDVTAEEVAATGNSGASRVTVD